MLCIGCHIAGLLGVGPQTKTGRGWRPQGLQGVAHGDLGLVSKQPNRLGRTPALGPRPSRPHAGRRPAVQIVRLFPDDSLASLPPKIRTVIS
jgi:hypothetical protein